jgi:hypothetical protein
MTRQAPHIVSTFMPLCQLNALSPQSCREQTVESCAEALAEEIKADRTGITGEKKTELESLEKWAFRCDAASLDLDFEEFRNNLSRIALRILLDALLYKLGYRQVEWTEEEVARWEQRKKAAGLSRGEVPYKLARFAKR